MTLFNTYVGIGCIFLCVFTKGQSQTIGNSHKIDTLSISKNITIYAVVQNAKGAIVFAGKQKSENDGLDYCMGFINSDHLKAPEIHTWHKKGEQIARSIIETAGGNYILAGSSTLIAGELEVHAKTATLLKINNQGEIVFEKSCSDKQTASELIFLLQKTKEKIFAVGIKDKKPWLIELDTLGAKHSEKYLSNDFYTPTAFKKTSSNTILVLLAGTFKNKNRSKLLWLNAEGEVVWEKLYDNFYLNDLVVKDDGSLYLTGKKVFNITRASDAAFLKVNAKGDIQDSLFSNQNRADEGLKLVKDKEGYLWQIGTVTPFTFRDIYIQTFDTAFSVNNTKPVNNIITLGKNKDDIPQAVCLTTNNTIVLAATLNNNEASIYFIEAYPPAIQFEWHTPVSFIENDTVLWKSDKMPIDLSWRAGMKPEKVEIFFNQETLLASLTGTKGGSENKMTPVAKATEQGKIQKIVKIPLIGLNEITITAKNHGRKTGETKKIVRRELPNLFIISIGINYPSLNYPKDDAQAFASTFKKQGKGLFNNILDPFVKIIDSTYSKEKCQKEFPFLEKLENEQTLINEGINRIDANDILLCYISGHSLYDSNKRKFKFPLYKYTSNTDENVLDFKDDILNKILNIPCQKVLFVDACNAGAIVELYGEELKKKNIHYFLSCKENQLSKEDDEKKQSVFTQVLLEFAKNMADSTTFLRFNETINAEFKANRLDSILLKRQIELRQLETYLEQRVPIKSVKGFQQNPVFNKYDNLIIYKPQE